MQLIAKVTNLASLKRGQLPALLAVSMLFMFMLAACQVAVADDGTIKISPEQTTGTATGTDGNTIAGQVRLASSTAPDSTTPIDPNQVYEWNGFIKWVDRDGGHFIVDRGCDSWAVIPASDEIYGKLKELNGSRGTVWGTVNFEPNIYGMRAINGKAAYGPNDIRPMIALPEIPCPDVAPVPGDQFVVRHGEATLHRDLVWRDSNLWLVTDRGNVRLELPAIAMRMFPELDIPSSDAASALSISLGEYGVVGNWRLDSTGLVVAVREVSPWPHRTFVKDPCGAGIHQFQVADNQVAVHGSLFISDGGIWKLETPSGVVYIHRFTAADGSVVSPDTVAGAHDVVVIGEWKTDGTEFHMMGEKFVRVKTVCEPPQPPQQPILPGEIAALGHLVFENGRPYLDTPQGRIVLLTRSDVEGGEPQPATADNFKDADPGAGDAAASPGTVRLPRLILVVGKWQVRDDQLVILVRYALPWPQPTAVETNASTDPQSLPPVFSLPAPMPPVMGFPVEPVRPAAGFDIGDDAVIIGPDGVIAVEPVAGAVAIR
jgi:hypothetical protein